MARFTDSAAPIVFSTDSFRTSPEQDSPSMMTSEMFVMMTDKQTKPEGSSGAKGLQLVLSLHPHFQDMTVVDFSTGKIYFCQFLESTPDWCHSCGWIRSEGNCQQIVQSTGYFRSALYPDRNETVQLMTRIAVSVKKFHDVRTLFGRKDFICQNMDLIWSQQRSSSFHWYF